MQRLYKIRVHDGARTRDNTESGCRGYTKQRGTTEGKPRQYRERMYRINKQGGTTQREFVTIRGEGVDAIQNKGAQRGREFATEGQYKRRGRARGEELSTIQ